MKTNTTRKVAGVGKNIVMDQVVIANSIQKAALLEAMGPINGCLPGSCSIQTDYSTALKFT